MQNTTPTLFERIRKLLRERGVPFMTMHHAETRTSADSASARGEALEMGAKALVVKIDDRFALFVLSAALRFDAAKVRERLGVSRVRFATPEELREHTGLPPGAVPPFGRPILPLDLYVDASITRLDRMAFNAGSQTDSITMRAADYLALVEADIFDFAEAAPSEERTEASHRTA